MKPNQINTDALVQALSASREWEGDSEPLRIAMGGIDLLAVDPAREMLMVMRASTAQVRNGRPVITMICERVVTGNEYRVWQQTGNVPPMAEDAGSTPAARASCQNVPALAQSGGEKTPTKESNDE